MQQLFKEIEKSIETLSQLAEEYSQKEGWIVESENHVNVGYEKGLKDTMFTVKSPVSVVWATIYSTRVEAEQKGADYYLVDGRNEPIQMVFTKADTFFQRECENAKKLLLFIRYHSK